MNVFNIFLGIHISGGAIGLLSGTINIIRKKGDNIHRLAGKIFLYGMLAAGFAALYLSIVHPNYFLFIVGVFTIYMVSTGQRYLSLKQLAADQKPMVIDWALAIAMLITGAAFVGLGVYNLTQGDQFGIVFIVFGALGLRMAMTDFKNYRGKSDIKNIWLVIHLQRMIGAYIAAVTAFIVVNVNNKVNFIPSYVVWLLPTIVLVPLIFKWTRKYQVKKKA